VRRGAQGGADETVALGLVDQLSQLLGGRQRLDLQLQIDSELDERVAAVRLPPRDAAGRRG
jgi:hypothetical protein